MQDPNFLDDIYLGRDDEYYTESQYVYDILGLAETGDKYPASYSTSDPNNIITFLTRP
jgi:hypothetical protein